MRQPVAVLEPTSAVACCAPIADPGLNEEEAVATAELFRALGDPARVRILHILATQTDTVCGCDLEQPLGLSQPTVSFHLKKLHEAGRPGSREARGLGLLLAQPRGAAPAVRCRSASAAAGLDSGSRRRHLWVRAVGRFGRAADGTESMRNVAALGALVSTATICASFILL